MKTLIRLAARLYPKAWRDRYESEFDALLEDISPSWQDLWNVLGLALAMRGKALIEGGLMAPALSPRTFSMQLPVFISLATHAVVLSFATLASWSYEGAMPPHRPGAPMPPPSPYPPAALTDPRVFRDVSMLYSSLPLRLSARDATVPTHVVEGVGIYFPPLPDAGASYRRRNPTRRVWPGQMLEANVVRRAIPQYPSGTIAHGAVSVFVEYLIGIDGSVKVLRTSGPTPFANSARSAVEGWEYRPVKFEDRRIEIVSRVEVRFDGDLARAVK